MGKEETHCLICVRCRKHETCPFDYYISLLELLCWFTSMAFDLQFTGTNVSPPDMQEQEQKIAKVQSWIQGYLQAVQDLQNS